MIAIRTRPALLGIAVIASLAALAQDSPEPKLSLSGTYELKSVNVSETTVSMDFTAVITNNGPEDVSGKVVLRHPNDIQKVYGRFGDTSIPAGGNATVSSVVNVPRREYDGWANAGGPSVFFNTQNERGDIKVHRVPLSETRTPAK